jgi:hypothetical protein
MGGMNMRKIIILLITILSLTLLSVCGEDEYEDDETKGWIRIDKPVEGTHTGQTTIWLEGDYGLHNGNYPDGGVSWSSGGQSSFFEFYDIDCFFACIGSFGKVVPLSSGENIITVRYIDASDSVTVTRN